MSTKRVADDETKKSPKKEKKEAANISIASLNHDTEIDSTEGKDNSIMYRNKLIDNDLGITDDADISTLFYRKSLIESIVGMTGGADQEGHINNIIGIPDDTDSNNTDNSIVHQDKNRVWLAAPTGNKRASRIGDDYQAVI